MRYVGVMAGRGESVLVAIQEMDTEIFSKKNSRNGYQNFNVSLTMRVLKIMLLFTLLSDANANMNVFYLLMSNFERTFLNMILIARIHNMS